MPKPTEEAEANDNRPEAEHLSDAGKKPAIVTSARSEAARAEWELVHMKTQVAMERAKRQRDC